MSMNITQLLGYNYQPTNKTINIQGTKHTNDYMSTLSMISDGIDCFGTNVMNQMTHLYEQDDKFQQTPSYACNTCSSQTAARKSIWKDWCAKFPFMPPSQDFMPNPFKKVYEHNIQLEFVVHSQHTSFNYQMQLVGVPCFTTIHVQLNKCTMLLPHGDSHNMIKSHGDLDKW